MDEHRSAKDIFDNIKPLIVAQYLQFLLRRISSVLKLPPHRLGEILDQQGIETLRCVKLNPVA
jgi:hypothetical protein